MCIWDGSPIQPEDEREQDWQDPDDADYTWTEGQGEPDGDDWKENDDEELYPNQGSWGSYWLFRGMGQAEDEDDERSRGKRRKRNNDDEADGG